MISSSRRGNAPQTMRDLVEKYVAVKIHLSPGSIEQMRIAVHLLDLWAGRPVLVSELSEELLAGWLRFLSEQPCSRADGVYRSAATVNGKRRTIVTLWHYAHRRGWHEVSPRMLDLPKLREPKKIPVAFTIDELARLYQAAARARTVGDWTPRHLQGLILFLYDTALRISATLKLRRAAVNWQRASVTVPAETQKGRREIVRYVRPETLGVLAELPPTDMLFPWPKGVRALQQEWKLTLAAAGVPVDRYHGFHGIRRSTVTQVYILSGREGAQEAADHVSDCLAHYVDTRQTQTQDNAAFCNQLPRIDGT